MQQSNIINFETAKVKAMVDAERHEQEKLIESVDVEPDDGNPIGDGPFYRMRMDISVLDREIIAPLQYYADIAFAGRSRSLSLMVQEMAGLYAEQLHRRYNSVNYQTYYRGLARLHELQQKGKAILPTMNADSYPATEFFKAMDRLYRTKVVDQSIVVNGITLYPIRLMYGKLRNEICYDIFNHLAPDVLRLAKRLRKDIYMTSEFHFAVGEWLKDYPEAVDHLELIDQQYYLNPMTRLAVINI